MPRRTSALIKPLTDYPHAARYIASHYPQVDVGGSLYVRWEGDLAEYVLAYLKDNSGGLLIALPPQASN